MLNMVGNPKGKYYLRKQVFANAKTKTQIGCAVTVQLIGHFVFPT